jgi:ferredoxin
MRVVVDLNRCRSYGQCVFAAPKVFHFDSEQSLEYDYRPHDSTTTAALLKKLSLHLDLLDRLA